MINLIPRCIQPSEVVVKRGSLLRLKYLYGKKSAVIAGRDSLRTSGKLNDIMGYLTAAGMDVTIMDPVRSEPVAESVKQYAEQLKQINPDYIVGCGGGAVMDTAKLAWALLENPDNQLEDFYKPFSIPEKLSKSKLIAIPTTSGSGSEMSNIAVITDSVAGRKILISSTPLMPDIVILDASLTLSLSLQQTVSTALDAMTHAFESYCSSVSHTWGDMFALTAGKIIRQNLEKVLTAPEDIVAREKLLYGASYAGYAQNVAYVGAAHAFAHTLGALYGVQHGLACAVFLPRIALVNAQFTPKAEIFAREIGLQTVNHFVEWVYQMLNQAGLPNSWQKSIGEGKEINGQKMIDIAMKDPCIRTAPKRLTSAQWTQVLTMEPSCTSMSF